MTKLEAICIIKDYGGSIGAAEIKLNKLCILKWITPEILKLKEAIEVAKKYGYH